MLGIKVCSAGDWVGIALYVKISAVLTYFSIKQMKQEQELKIEFGQGLGKSDKKLDKIMITKLLIVSFIGGLS